MSPRGHHRACAVYSLSYLRVFWRTAQQSFNSLCFCVTRAASAGCRLDSWETVTSSIWNHTERHRKTNTGVRMVFDRQLDSELTHLRHNCSCSYNGIWILDRTPWFDWQCPEFPRLCRFPLHCLERGFFSGWKDKKRSKTINNIIGLHQHLNIQCSNGVYIHIKGHVEAKWHRSDLPVGFEQK